MWRGSSGGSKPWKSAFRPSARSRADEDRRLRAAGSVRARRDGDAGGDRSSSSCGTRDHEAELVRIPFKWYPGARPLREALVWRLVDLEEAQGRPIDLVIATKFPSYAIRHPNKVVWLVHQFRQAYELDGPSSDSSERTRPIAQPSARSIDSIARRWPRLDACSRSLRTWPTGSSARPGSTPKSWSRRRSSSTTVASDGVGEFILSVGRLDRAKRIDLLLEAAAVDSGLRVVVAGDGPDRDRLEQLSAEHGLDGRVTFAGRVADDELVDLYADCLAVFYAPLDEDLGLVPYEAFLSRKPVVTTRDAGGPLEVVVDRVTGLVCDPAPRAVAERMCVVGRELRPGTRLWPRRQASRRARHLGRCRRPAPRLLKVAYFSPLPPERSGIADYSALLLPALRQRVDVQVVPRGAKKPPRSADVALYHVGNNPEAHGWIVDALRRQSGLVVLHEFVLHHLVAGLTLGRGDADAYLNAMQRDAGVVGRLLAHGVVDHSAAAALGRAARGVPARGRDPRSRGRPDLPFAVRRGPGANVRLRRADLGGADARMALGGCRNAAGAARTVPGHCVPGPSQLREARASAPPRLRAFAPPLPRRTAGSGRKRRPGTGVWTP